MKNLTFFVKTGCPYCAAVIHKLEELGLEWEEKNISDVEVVEELMKRGGKRQVPYMVDLKKGVEMYESGDIVEYLDKNYGSGATTVENEAKDVSEGEACEVK